MKWIGQHIWSFISRFRNDVYLEDLSTTTETDVLTVDSNGKVSKRAASGLTVSSASSATLASTVTVTDISSDVNAPVVFHNESNGLFDDTGAFYYNPSTGTLVSNVGSLGSLSVTSSSTLGSQAVTIDHNDIDQHALKIDGTGVTTGDIINISADSLTTGRGIFMDTADAEKEIVIDKDYGRTTSHDGTVIKISSDKTTTTGDGNTYSQVGITSSISDAGRNHANATNTIKNLYLTSNMGYADGTTSVYGIHNILTGAADVGIGIYSTVDNSLGPDIRMASSANQSDYCQISTGANGATIIETVDADATEANFEIAADGNIDLDAAGNIDINADGGTITLADGGLVLGSFGTSAIALAKATTVTGDFTVNGDSVTINSSSADDPLLQLVNTTNDDEGARIIIKKSRADDAVASGQNVGEIVFRGQDDGQADEDYAQIVAEIDVSTHGQESGKITHSVAAHDGGNHAGLILQGGSESGEVDVTIAKGTASLTTVAGNLDLGGYLKKRLHYVHCDIKDTGSDMTDEYYLSLGDADREATSALNVAIPIIIPATGVLKKVIKRTQSDFSAKAWSYKLKKVPSGTALGSNTLIATVTKNAGGAANTNSIIDFTTDASDAANACTFESGFSTSTQFSAGDSILFSYQCTSGSGPSGTPKVVWTLVFELDESTVF